MKFETNYLGEWALNQGESPVMALCETLHEKIMAEQEEKLAACMNERRNNMNKLVVVVPVHSHKLYETRYNIYHRLLNKGLDVKYESGNTNGLNALVMRNCKIEFRIVPIDVESPTPEVKVIVDTVVRHERENQHSTDYTRYTATAYSAIRPGETASTNLYQQGLAICKKMARTSHMSSIKNVIFNPPATIVYWADGSKTVVKTHGTDTFDKTTGLAMAIAKKHFGNDPYFNEIFRKWVPEYDEKKEAVKHIPTPIPIFSRILREAFEDARDEARRVSTSMCDLIKAAGAGPKPAENKPETCRERLMREHPEEVSDEAVGGCNGCPHHYYYAEKPSWCGEAHYSNRGAIYDECKRCWDRPVEETPVHSGDQSWGNVKPKYEFTGETRMYHRRTLHRIRAARDIYFPSGRLFVKKGELGGWIEHEENLSHDGSCWVGEEACVLQDAAVINDAYVHGCAVVRNHALVGQEAQVSEFARVIGNAAVYENAYVHGHALVYGEAAVHVNAEICDGAAVGGEADVGRHAKICGKAKITNPILYSEVTIDGREK